MSLLRFTASCYLSLHSLRQLLGLPADDSSAFSSSPSDSSANTSIVGYMDQAENSWPILAQRKVPKHFSETKRAEVLESAETKGDTFCGAILSIISKNM